MPRTRDLFRRLASAFAPSRRTPAASSGLVLGYAPRPDGRPDPGEIVWTWVPYEDDPRKGKDRPVLLVGRRGDALVGVMLTSKDHDRDAADEARWGRHWLDIGSGAWDRQGRPSEVRLDRLITVDPTAVRREGAVLAQSLFDEVVAGVRQHADVR